MEFYIILQCGKLSNQTKPSTENILKFLQNTEELAR